MSHAWRYGSFVLAQYQLQLAAAGAGGAAGCRRGRICGEKRYTWVRPLAHRRLQCPRCSCATSKMHSIETISPFDQTVLLLLIAAVAGLLAARLKQPVLIGFIAVGVLVGPSAMGWLGGEDEFDLLAEIGLALLLFVVGLKLDLKLIRTMGPVALATGLGQVIFTSVGGYLIALALGMTAITAVYTAVALTFSSTIIIVKLLSDKRETESLHGRIAVGFLIVQDIVVVLVMIALTSYAGTSEGNMALQTGLIFTKGMAMLAGVGLMMTLIIPRALPVIARSAELLVLCAIVWALAMAALSNYLGFSKEVGAFLAGVALASTDFREIIGARLVSLRDFLLLFFFIDLGTRLDLSMLGSQVWDAVPLSIFVLIGNPIIVMIIMGYMGYRKRTGFLAGLAVAQISEFSLILAALGLRLGHIDTETVGIITLVGFITIGLSTYMILYSQQLYARLAPYLDIFERKDPFREKRQDALQPGLGGVDVILYGCGQYGTNLAATMLERGRTVLGVDFDPQTVKAWKEAGRTAWFGDAEDPEFPSALPLHEARWVVSAVGDRDSTISLMHSVRNHGFTGGIAVTARTPDDIEEFKRAGADVVFAPFSDAAAEAADRLVAAEQQELRRKMDQIISDLSNHYIVCGYGRMGKQIVKDLRQSRLPHVVIEWNPEQIPHLFEEHVLYIEGRATEDEVLIGAGIHKARGLIAVTATDEENVFIVLTARGLNPDLYIVARSIQEENEDKLRRAGANRVVSPYILGGRRMAAAVIKPRTVDFLDIVMHSESGQLEFADLVVKEDSGLAHKTLQASGIRRDFGITVLAVKRKGEKIHSNPEPDFVLQPGDELIVMGGADAIARAGALINDQPAGAAAAG